MIREKRSITAITAKKLNIYYGNSKPKAQSSTCRSINSQALAVVQEIDSEFLKSGHKPFITNTYRSEEQFFSTSAIGNLGPIRHGQAHRITSWQFRRANLTEGRQREARIN
jgi:hypothetical protein